MQPTLDPTVVNLAKAIRQTESGGNFNARGKSGEVGAYQFTPDTWNTVAPKYGITVPIDQATPEQQNAVAYNRIKAWKDAGHDVTQIASMWNAGENEPNAYTGKFMSDTGSHKAGDPSEGVNKFGARYSVPDYAKSVANAYLTLKGGGAVDADPNNPSSTASTENESVVPPEEQSSMVGNFVKGLVSPVATMVARPIQAGAELLGASSEAVDKFSKDHLGGLVAPVPQNDADVEKDVGRGIQTVALGAGPESMAAAGAGFGLGGSLEQGNDLLSVKTALDTALGAAGGKLLGIIGKPIFNVAGKVVGEITPAFLKDLVAQGTEAIQKFAAQHEIVPEGVSNVVDRVTNKISDVADVAKQAMKDELPSFGNKSVKEILATPAEDVSKLSARDQKIWHDQQADVSIKAAKEAGEKSLADSKAKIQNFSTQIAETGKEKASTLKEPAKKLMKTSSQEYQSLAEGSAKNSPNMGKTVSHADLRDKIEERFQDDPTLADSLRQDLGIKEPATLTPEQIASGEKIQEPKPFTNQQILDKAREIMQSVSKSARSGSSSFSADEYEAMKKYSFLMDTLGENGVDMSEANKFWREWKPVQKQIIRDIKPFNDNEIGSLPSTLNKATATANTPAQAVAKQRATAFIKELETRLKLPEGSIDAETRKAMESLEKEKLNQTNLRKISQEIIKEIRTTTKNTKLDIQATADKKKSLIKAILWATLGLGVVSSSKGRAALHAVAGVL